MQTNYDDVRQEFINLTYWLIKRIQSNEIPVSPELLEQIRENVKTAKVYL